MKNQTFFHFWFEKIKQKQNNLSMFQFLIFELHFKIKRMIHGLLCHLFPFLLFGGTSICFCKKKKSENGTSRSASRLFNP